MIETSALQNATTIMAVLSIFRVARNAIQTVKQPLLRCSPQSVNNSVMVAVRQMSHKRVMKLIPSDYEHRMLMDNLRFFIALGLIPIAIVIIYTNLFIGQAKLVDIPEDYEPKHWEYYKNPISRFIAKYAYDPPERYYETHLHVLYTEQERVKLRFLERKVRKLMGERGDYKGWYYLPYNDKRVYLSRQIEDAVISDAGSGDV